MVNIVSKPAGERTLWTGLCKFLGESAVCRQTIQTDLVTDS